MYAHTYTHTHTQKYKQPLLFFFLQTTFIESCERPRYFKCMSAPSVIDFIFLGFKITVDGDCSHQIDTCFVKEESGKVGLKLNIQKTKIMASGPITSWQIDGETVETVAGFIWGAPKSLQMVIAAMKLKDTYSLEGKL